MSTEREERTMTMTDLSLRAERRTREQRVSRPMAFRAAATDDGTVTFEGYACVFNEGYSVWDWYGEYTEVVEPGAFAKSLAEKDDVRLLINHDGLPLARTKSGTMELSEDETGLFCRATLDETDPDVMAVAKKMRRGDLDEMSFAFKVTRQTWSPDYMQRNIQECKLYDVSIVTYPANPATSAWLRAADLGADLSRMKPEELLAGARSMGTDPVAELDRLAVVLGGVSSGLRDLVRSTRSAPTESYEPGMKLSEAKAEMEALRRSA